MKFKSPPGLSLLLLLAITAPVPAFRAGAEITRADFAKAMGTVKPGMTATEVEKILGKPDDIVTEYDPGADWARTAETWSYGADGHLAFATLGCIFMKEGKVRSLRGADGTPPDPNLFKEDELRGLLRLIDKCEDGNPLDLIRIVNTLQPLGKEKALAAISEYLRVASHYGDRSQENGVFLVLRLLFQVPEDPGYMPRMLVGAPEPAEPKDPKIVPLFPLVLIDDIPLNLVYGYSMGGEAEPAENHVEYFRKIGKLREHPLHPTDDPLSVLAKIQGSPQWLYGSKPGSSDFEIGPAFLANQLLTLVASVYWIKPDYKGYRISGHFDQEDWDRTTKVFAQLHVKWDAQQNIYTFADGTTLPEIKQPVYRRQIWEPASLKPDARVVFERLNAKVVRVILSNYQGRGLGEGKSVIRIYRPWNKERPLAQFDNFQGETETLIDLEAGSIVQADAVFKTKTEKSPVLTP